jgi:hypothetical protein
VNIYSAKEFLPRNFYHGPLLFPFWGFRPLFGDAAFDVHRFENYMEKGPDLFRLTSLEEARVAVLPFEWDQIVNYVLYQTAQGFTIEPDGLTRAVAVAEEFAALAATKGRPTIVFLSQDGTEEVPLGNSVVFRTSLTRSKRRSNEYVLPYWMPDAVEASFGSKPPVREKTTRPVIGFCGQSPVKLDARTRLNYRVTKVPGLSGVAFRLGVRDVSNYSFYVRARALEAVSRSREVRSNFLLREGWFNGAFQSGGLDRPLLHRSWKEYVENMFESDYVLCARGNGNYSIRFYETLRSGRIPIFINTSCVLPFEEWIDWKQYYVWVEEHEVRRIPEMVLEFHERLSDREFKDRQLACRQLWLDWLSPYGFFKNFCRYFNDCT